MFICTYIEYLERKTVAKIWMYSSLEEQRLCAASGGCVCLPGRLWNILVHHGH